MTLRRLSRILTALAVLAILAGPAWSARVVEVRVGNHPSFSRVVFELDAPAGYRIERRTVDGGEEIVVELSAASAPRKVKSGSSMVAGVDLEQSGTESIARIRLRGASPRVKEMILGGPPRIVLDVMRPEQVAKPAAAPKPEAAPSADAAKPAVAKAPEKTAASKGAEAIEPSPAVAKPSASTVTEKPEPSKVAGKPAAAKTVETPVPPKVAQKAEPPKVAEAPKPSVDAQRLATPPAPEPADAPIARVESALEGERVVQPNAERPDRAAELAPSAGPGPAPLAEAPAVAPPAAEPTKPVAKAPSAPAPARPGAKASGPFGLPFGDSESWLPLGLVGAGLLLFLVVVAMLLRRHSKPTSLDALELAREAGEPMESDGAFETIAGSGQSAAPSFPVAGPGLFDDEREKGESEMDVVAELPIERGSRSATTPMPVGAGSDVGALVEQLERRLAQLESRLDEANEARERLERQVTAQSEELRVQRAAIARTQRALRGMTRGGEEQATEPALRDPSKPSSGRT